MVYAGSKSWILFNLIKANPNSKMTGYPGISYLVYYSYLIWKYVLTFATITKYLYKNGVRNNYYIIFAFQFL